MSQSPPNLLNFIRDLAQHLALGTELPVDEIADSLTGVQQTLSELYAQYEEPPPAGAEVIQEFMLEALQMFHQAIEELFAFFEDSDREHLTQAVLLAEEGDDILSSIEYVIEQKQQWMSQFTVG
ncbi:MAG: hypothetical protein HY319_28255 [Armatimonadetes bacterium]|nr:hypothetical protein [Armatimonadota bacterium]